jgi:hypothetical protein
MNQEIKNIFFEALEYPEYSRPFFYLKKQQESGWHRAIFLQALLEEYWRYDTTFNIKLGAAKIKNQDIQKDQIRIDIAIETNGKVKGEFTHKTNNELKVAILSVYEIDRPKQRFSNVEVLTFIEYSLWFIRNEFRYQIGDESASKAMFRPRTKTYFRYSIIAEAPFLDFPVFKNAVRELLWNSNNFNELKTTLKNYRNAANEIVDIWNTKLFKIEQVESDQSSTNDKDLPETVLLELKHESLSHSWWNNSEIFDIRGPKRYTNQDFASFAVKIVNFLSNEILNKGKEVTLNEKDFLKDLLDGIYELSNNSVLAPEINFIKLNGRGREHPFRDYFKACFRSAGYHPEIEAPKDDGRIDLRVSHKAIGNKIIEFKGWWNSDKKSIVKQLNNYLTMFEDDGYIFLIDSTKSGIIKKYKQIIMSPECNCEDGSWESITYHPTSYRFFKSIHSINGSKRTIFHFIFPVWNK